MFTGDNIMIIPYSWSQINIIINPVENLPNKLKFDILRTLPRLQVELLVLLLLLPDRRLEI